MNNPADTVAVPRELLAECDSVIESATLPGYVDKAKLLKRIDAALTASPPATGGVEAQQLPFAGNAEALYEAGLKMQGRAQRAESALSQLTQAVSDAAAEGAIDPDHPATDRLMEAATDALAVREAALGLGLGGGEWLGLTGWRCWQTATR